METQEHYDAGDVVDKVTHTPGPWRVEEIDAAIYVRGADGHLIGEVGDMGYNVPEDRANAALVIAAPELLEMCELAYLYICGYRVIPSGPMLTRLRAAVEKAKGQQS